ncbi:MAG: hypothetical protein QM775_00365 [Pirellulales bacterium]
MKKQSQRMCENCRTPFFGGSAAKFCCEDCRKVARPENHYRPEKICEVCKNPYKGRQESKYCGAKCKGKAYSYLLGENEKYCGHCETVKPLSDFHSNAANKSGKGHHCKICWAKVAQVQMRRQRFNRARAIAKKRGLEWSLSKAEYEALVSQGCYYCGFPINETGIGLDRLDNTRRIYVADNVVPCCGRCNQIKSDEFTPEEMRKIAILLNELRAARGINPIELNNF